MPQAAAAEVARIHRAATRLDHALTAVACGALAFSTVNVTLLAIDHGIPAPIAWMLEPLVGVALWAVLSSDAVLSRHGVRTHVSAWLLRTFTGLITLVLNVWSSVFTTRGDGSLAFTPDPAGIVLHAVAPVLLILLAEAAPQYRTRFAHIAARVQADAHIPHAPADPTPPHATRVAHNLAPHPPPAPSTTRRRPTPQPPKTLGWVRPQTRQTAAQSGPRSAKENPVRVRTQSDSRASDAAATGAPPPMPAPARSCAPNPTSPAPNSPAA